MSRTRGMKEIDLWWFPKTTTDTTNHLEQTDQVVGYHFGANELDDRIKAEVDVLFGRAKQATTVQRYITKANYEFVIGDNVAETATPNEFSKSTIQQIMRKPIHKRGARHNAYRQYVTIIEVS